MLAKTDGDGLLDCFVAGSSQRRNPIGFFRVNYGYAIAGGLLSSRSTKLEMIVILELSPVYLVVGVLSRCLCTLPHGIDRYKELKYSLEMFIDRIILIMVNKKKEEFNWKRLSVDVEIGGFLIGDFG